MKLFVHSRGDNSFSVPDGIRAAVWVGAAAAVWFPLPPCIAQFASTTPSPATMPAGFASIDVRIREHLLQHGNVNALVQELQAADQADTNVLRDVVRVAKEQGNLVDALRALRRLVLAVPNDVDALEDLATVQDQSGLDSESAATLRAAIAATADAPRRARLTLRLAILTFDSGRPDDGRVLLDDAVACDPTVASQAGVIAYLYKMYAASAGFMDLGAAHRPVALTLLRGNAALHAGDFDRATQAFDAALENASTLQDKRFAQERLIATARRSGRLGALADAWVRQADIPVERPLALAAVLRELGRVPDLIAWWRARLAGPNPAAALLADRFVSELIEAARESGLAAEAEAVGRDVLARTPSDPQSLATVLQILLNERKYSEADSLLMARIVAASDDAERLLSIGRTARSAYRDDVARAAAGSLKKMGGRHAIAGLLLESSVLIRAGERQSGLALLQQAADLTTTQPDAIDDVTTALEAAHQEPQAIRLLQTRVDSSNDDATRERLSVLLMQQRRYPEAINVLQTLRHAAASEGLRGQASQRLIEAALANKSLDGLIASLRERVDSGTADLSDVSLLVDAYGRNRNWAEAAGVLKSTRLLDEAARLARLAVVYLRAHRLDEASETLRQLVAADPMNATATLEQLASVELDRKRPQAAADAIAEIARRAGQAGSTLDLMGGIYDRLGQPAEAAVFYRRALAARPENADNWLLWSTAVSKAGRPAEAVQRLQVLCQSAESTAVFGLAVDGLLNLKASSLVLRAARREAMLRLAARPQDAMLYHVVGDLSEELADASTLLSSIDASLSANVDERGDRLRQLMEVAMNRGMVEDASEWGRSVLAIGDDFPPRLFVQLGEQLLIAGRITEASSAFARAEAVSSDEAVAPQAAELFERYGSPARGLEAIRPLADRKISDLPLLLRVARLQELTGDDAAAFDQYVRAIAVAAKQAAAPPETDVISGQTSSVEQVGLTRLVDGAIATARTPERQEILIATLQTRVDELDRQPAKTGQMPRGLAQIGSQLRRVCLLFGRPEQADRLDRRLIDQWPTEASGAWRTIGERTRLGLYSAAEHFAGPATTRPSTQPEVLAANAAAVLPALIAGGKQDEARRLLVSVPLALPLRQPESVATFVAAAAALGDDELATDWALVWLSGTVPAADRKTVFPPGQVVTTAYRCLSAAGKKRLAERIVELSREEIRQGKPGNFSIVALQLAATGDVDVPGRLDIALRLAAQPLSIGNLSLTGSSGVASLINLLQAADRPAFVRRVVEQSPLEGRLQLLQRIVGQAIEPFDEQTNAAIVMAANEISGPQTLGASTWFMNRQHAAVLPAIAAAALRAAAAASADPNRVTALVSAASALADREPGEAEQAANQAIAILRSIEKPSAAEPPARASAGPARRDVTVATRPSLLTDRLDLFRTALKALSLNARRRVLASLDSGSKASEDASWPWLMKAAVLDSLCRRDEALLALRSACDSDPKNDLARRVYLARLVTDGRTAELAGAFATRQTVFDSTTRRSLNGALIQLFRPYEVALAPATVGASYQPELVPLDFMTPLANGDTTTLAARLRALLERQRGGNGRPFINETDAEGLSASTATSDALKTFDTIGAWPGAAQDLAAALRTASPGSPYAEWLAGLLVKAIIGQGRAVPAVTPLIAELQQHAASRCLTSNDRLVIRRLAVVPGVKLPTPLLDELWTSWVHDNSGDHDHALLQALNAQGDPRAVGVRQWIIAGQWRPSNTTDADAAVALSPVDRVEDLSTADRIGLLLDAGHIDQAEQGLARLRQTGRISSGHFRCGFVWARIAAERGDLPGFRARIQSVLEGQAWTTTATGMTEINRSLPSRSADAAGLRAAVACAVELVSASAGRSPDDTNWTRALTVTGRWAADHGDAVAAGGAFEAARTLADAQGAGEHQLWVADLGRLLGRSDVAWQIERRLLTEQCLPAVRIVPLLNHLTETGDGPAARQLAAAAARYCQEPTLQARVRTDRGRP